MMNKPRTAGRAVLLLCLMLCVLLPSCKCREEVPDSTQAGETDAASGVTAFPVSLIPQMKVVYPQDSSADVKFAAEQLCDLINAVYDTEIAVTTDYLRENSSIFCEYEYEILIGATNRKESIAYREGLRGDSYGYTVSGKKL